jgi:hypothetical protein
MNKVIFSIVLLFFLGSLSVAQVRSDFETVEEYDNYLLRNFGHAFVGQSRQVFVDEIEAIPFVNWWKILSQSCGNNERGLPDLLDLDEAQRMLIYKSMHQIGENRADKSKQFLADLDKASPEEAKEMTQNWELLHSNVNIARTDNETQVAELPNLFDKSQQRELKKIASARLQANVNLFALINKLQQEEGFELTPEEKKRFQERLQEVNAELSLELIRLRAKAWDDVLGVLDRETREKLESKMLLNKVK